MVAFSFEENKCDALYSGRGAMIHAPSPIKTAASFDFSEIEAYWRNPAPFEAARIAGQAQIDALFVEHDAAVRRAQEARWALEEVA